MKSTKAILVVAVFLMLVFPSSALTLEEGLNSTNQKLTEMADAYDAAVENGTVVNQQKYQESLELFNESLDSFYNISEKIKQVAPEEYKEGNLAMETARYYLEIKEDPLKVRTLVRVFKGEGTEIIYMAEHDGEEPPEEKAEMLGDVNYEKAESVIVDTREKLSDAISLYKAAMEGEEVKDQEDYVGAISSMEDAIKIFEDNQRFIKATEKSEAEYDEAISVLYTGKYFMEINKPASELDDIEKLFSEEETPEILSHLKKAASSNSTSEREENTKEAMSSEYTLAIISGVVILAVVVLYMRKEKIV